MLKQTALIHDSSTMHWFWIRAVTGEWTKYNINFIVTLDRISSDEIIVLDGLRVTSPSIPAKTLPLSTPRVKSTAEGAEVIK